MKDIKNPNGITVILPIVPKASEFFLFIIVANLIISINKKRKEKIFAQKLIEIKNFLLKKIEIIDKSNAMMLKIKKIIINNENLKGYSLTT